MFHDNHSKRPFTYLSRESSNTLVERSLQWRPIFFKMATPQAIHNISDGIRTRDTHLNHCAALPPELRRYIKIDYCNPHQSRGEDLLAFLLVTPLSHASYNRVQSIWFFYFIRTRTLSD